MKFENIKPSPSKKQESGHENTEPESDNETVLGKIRKKTGAIARGMVLVGGLSVSSCNFDKYSPRADSSHQPTELALRLYETKLSESEYSKLCQDNPEKAFVTSPLYKHENWLATSLKQAAQKDPFLALEYASRYQANSGYDLIISSAINSLKELDKKSHAAGDEYSINSDYILTKYISAWINTSRAHELLEARRNNEYFFVPHFKEISQSKEGLEIGLKEIKLAAKSNPRLVLQYLNQYLSEPWAEEVIKTAALKEPLEFFDNIFLESKDNKQNKESRDKLIIETANSRPDAAVIGAAFNDGEVTAAYFESEPGKKLISILENSNNKNLKLIPEIRKMVFSGEIKYSESRKIVLLLDNISSGEITIQEALKTIKNPEEYFKVLINIIKNPNHSTFTLAEDYMSKGTLSAIEKINNLHEHSDQERFASLNGASAEKLYFTISYGEEEIFTSSFNGIFNRLLVSLKNENLSGAKLLEQENFAKFRTFIRTCTEFGRWNDFLMTMSPAEQNQLSQLFIAGVDKAKEPVREAVAIAEAINATSNPLILNLFEKEIKNQIVLMQNTKNSEIGILYNLIATTFAQKGGNDKWLKEIEKTYKLPSLSQLKSSELFNQNKLNIQEYFFYDDKDGKTSFTNFLSEYKKGNGWSIEDMGSYVVINSHNNERGIKIYANKPESETDGPEKIAQELKKQDIKTLVVVHRGHSYHAPETIKRIPSIAKIVSLGSCGGYRNLSAVLEKAPNAHIISTKGTGTKYVNDPLFKMLNEEIISGHDIVWSDFWEKARKKIGDDRFNEYVAPNKNFGAIFIKAYNEALQK
ncbi:MAG: hypothetical protein ACYC40_00650 [Patescibacteria group bacterium]